MSSRKRFLGNFFLVHFTWKIECVRTKINARGSSTCQERIVEIFRSCTDFKKLLINAYIFGIWTSCAALFENPSWGRGTRLDSLPSWPSAPVDRSARWCLQRDRLWSKGKCNGSFLQGRWCWRLWWSARSWRFSFSCVSRMDHVPVVR